MGGAPAARGWAINFLPRCIDVYVTLTTKKVVNFLGEEKCTPRKKILSTRMRKGPPPYVGMGPRMVNPAVWINVHKRVYYEKKL